MKTNYSNEQNYVTGDGVTVKPSTTRKERQQVSRRKTRSHLQAYIFRGLIIILILLLSSCSPKGFDFRDGEKEGVRFKRSIPQKTVNTSVIFTFIFFTPIVYHHEIKQRK